MSKKPASVAALFGLVLLLGACTALAATKDVTIKVTGMT